METRLQCTRLLHDDHMAATALMQRLRSLFAAGGPRQPPDTRDGAVGMLLADLIAGLGEEVPRHFRFEEDRLFPLLVAAGEGDIVDLLGEDHVVIEPLMRRLVGLARDVRASGFSAARWSEFMRLGNELAERLLAHIEREEIGLLPRLEEALEADADAALAGEYLINR